MESRLRRAARRPGAPFCGRTGARSPGPTSSPTEVWTARGLVTYYTLFVLDLESRQVLMVDSTPNPDAGFMAQAARRLTDAVDGFLASHRVLICDRDGKWTEGFRKLLEEAGVRIILTPFQAPNANAYAERFVRSIRVECLDHMVLLRERRLLRVLKELVRCRDHLGGWHPASHCVQGTASFGKIFHRLLRAVSR